MGYERPLTVYVLVRGWFSYRRQVLGSDRRKLGPVADLVDY